MKEIIENPTFKEIVEAYDTERTIFVCPKLDPKEKDYYSTIFKQFAPEGTVSFLSSGSSGTPKIHVHSWSNLKARARAQAKELGLNKSSHYLSPLPIHHLSGFMPIIRSLISESKITIKKKGESLRDLLTSEAPTHVSMVPTQLAELTKESCDLGFLETLLLGGAGCSEAVLNKAKELKYPVRACYGMTESASFFSIGKSEEFLKDGQITLYLMDGWKAYAGLDKRLTIESEMMYLGTIGPHGFRQSKNILPTFDIGEVNYPEIKIIGRSDLVFKSGGEKVDPLEVEKKLETNGIFNQVVIVPKADEKWGNITCAFIAPFRKGRDYSVLVEHLPKHQRPKHFLPLISSRGIKPRRSELKSLLEEQFEGNKKLPRTAFLHGFMGSKNDLKELASSLKKECYPVFWKLPFHDDNEDYSSFQEVIDVYVEKVRSEGIDIIYGYSMGGRLATAIAQKLEELGEPLTALFLESSHPGLKSKEEKEKRLISDKTLFDRFPAEPQKFFLSWYGQGLFGNFQETDLGKITIKEMTRRWNPEKWKRSLKILSTGNQKNYRGYLNASSHPILYLYGESDLKYKNLGSELKNQAQKNLIVKSLENGYHNLHLNHLERLNGPIIEVLNSLN